jgi:DNA-binding LacI/PurR family transcriptional regulator
LLQAELATRKLFAAGKRRVNALFGVNDIMAMGAMDVLRYELGRRIPDDLMVAGFDDIPDGARASYRLTTVRQPIDRMVEETLAILHLDDPYHPIERGIDRPIKGELIWRETIPGPPSMRKSAKRPASQQSYSAASRTDGS